MPRPFLFKELSSPLASSIPTPTKEWTSPKLESRCESALASIEGVRPEMMSRFEVTVSSAMSVGRQIKFDLSTIGNNCVLGADPYEEQSLSQATISGRLVKNHPTVHQPFSLRPNYDMPPTNPTPPPPIRVLLTGYGVCCFKPVQLDLV